MQRSIRQKKSMKYQTLFRAWVAFITSSCDFLCIYRSLVCSRSVSMTLPFISGFICLTLFLSLFLLYSRDYFFVLFVFFFINKLLDFVREFLLIFIIFNDNTLFIDHSIGLDNKLFNGLWEYSHVFLWLFPSTFIALFI